MKHLLTGMILGATLIPAAHADMLLGIRANAGYWNPAISGSFRSDGLGDINPADLGMDKQGATIVTLDIQHGVPLMPNVRLRHTALKFDETADLAVPASFNGKTFSGNVQSTIDVSHLDGTMYYNLIDTVAIIDVGITARIFGGRFAMKNASNDEEITLHNGLPMLYGRLGVRLPLTGLTASVETNTYSLSGNTLQDLEAKVAYESSWRVGVEGGYRSMTLKLDDMSNAYSDLKIKGPYLAGTVHF